MANFDRLPEFNAARRRERFLSENPLAGPEAFLQAGLLGLPDPQVRDARQQISGINPLQSLRIAELGGSEAPVSERQPSALEVLTGLRGGVQEQIGDVRSQRLEALGQTNQPLPEQVQRKRPEFKDLLIGSGVGLAARLAGASHQSVVGGFQNFFSGQQDRLDEEVEFQNTQNFQKTQQAIADASNRFKQLTLEEGFLQEDLDRFDSQISSLQKQSDDAAEFRRELTLDLNDQLQKAITPDDDGNISLTTSLLNSINSVGRRMGVEVIPPEEMEGMLKIASENDKRKDFARDASNRILADDLLKSASDVERLDDEKVISEANVLIKTAEAEIKQSQARIAAATEGDEVTIVQEKAKQAVSNSEIARLRAQTAEVEFKNLPEKIRLELSGMRAREASAWASAANSRSLAEARARGQNVTDEDVSREALGLGNQIIDLQREIEKSRKLKRRFPEDEKYEKAIAETEASFDTLMDEFKFSLTMFTDGEAQRQVLETLRKRGFSRAVIRNIEGG